MRVIERIIAVQAENFADLSVEIHDQLILSEGAPGVVLVDVSRVIAEGIRRRLRIGSIGVLMFVV